ncbi:6-phosphogluconolactonase [Mesonia ostreae]|uniref:6-phosphogluconolactonase n=1 Tax=Mesonia ostreae TaxID=861110 RepID=A0ABU2KH43_9FLAO|nr:6-phosphogluconolactonase [Mesonia ostreae]MDT0294033.1 6-phosphogluconolactonase [Mesonia ostreae]
MSQNFQKPASSNNLSLFADAEQASIYVAHQIAELIWKQQKQGKPAFLGLATGNTPKRVYQELIRLHLIENLSFANVISFNLDEYYPIFPEDNQSYTYFMRENLFRHIDMKPQHIHIPHVEDSANGIVQYCKDYEDKIASFGGLGPAVVRNWS